MSDRPANLTPQQHGMLTDWHRMKDWLQHEAARLRQQADIEEARNMTLLPEQLREQAEIYEDIFHRMVHRKWPEVLT